LIYLSFPKRAPSTHVLTHAHRGGVSGVISKVTAAATTTDAPSIHFWNVMDSRTASSIPTTDQARLL